MLLARKVTIKCIIITGKPYNLTLNFKRSLIHQFEYKYELFSTSRVIINRTRTMNIELLKISVSNSKLFFITFFKECFSSVGAYIHSLLAIQLLPIEKLKFQNCPIFFKSYAEFRMF